MRVRNFTAAIKPRKRRFSDFGSLAALKPPLTAIRGINVKSENMEIRFEIEQIALLEDTKMLVYKWMY